MAGLSGALALFAFGRTVRASSFAAGNGTITAAPTFSTGSSPSTTAISNVTCGTISDLPVIVLQEYVGLATDPALQCQCLEQVNNWLSTSSPPTRTLTRTIGTGVTTFTETISSTATVVTTVVNTVETITVTENFIVPQTNAWYGSASSPCCYSCTIGASTVEVFYFAEPTATTSDVIPVTSFTSNGFTFESPSVYIGFSSLSAFNYCGLVGKDFVNTTVGFNPGELSTITFSRVTGTPHTVTTSFSDGRIVITTARDTFYTPAGSAALNTQDLARNCSTIAGYSYIPGNPSNAIISSPDPCHPTIVVPDQVRSLDAAWASCISDGFGGFYDPPSALSPVTALIPTTTQPLTATTTPNPPRTTSSALPSSTSMLQPPLKTTTSTPHPSPPQPISQASSEASNPPPSSSGKVTNPVPPPFSTSRGADDGSAISPLPSSTSSSPGGGSNPPPPASSPNGGGNNGGNGGSGGSKGGGKGSGSPGNGGDNGSPPDGSNDNNSGGSSNSGGNGSGAQTGGGATDSTTAPQNTGNGAPLTPILAVGTATSAENSQFQFVFGSSTTPIPGGPTVTLGGTTLSLSTSGSSIIVNGATESISEAVSATPSSESTAENEIGSNGATKIGTGESGEPGFGSTNTASSGLPLSSVPTVPKSEAAFGLFSGVMSNIKGVCVTMLIAFYI
ncbi:hypothetical protein V8C37DRAFT_416234 [Trichoderma ceciliae]